MKRQWGSISAALLFISIPACLYLHRVPNNLTHEDRLTFKKISEEQRLPAIQKNPSLAQEIDLIRRIQLAILQSAPEHKGIPFGEPREPQFVIRKKYGLCYDRSRVIEKYLRLKGFTTRHIGLYSTVKTGSPLKSILSKGTNSHSLTEVKTQKGWLVVDSNAPWISLDASSQPVSIATLQKSVHAMPDWSQRYEPFMNGIYKIPFTYVYGLYSRHGRFYPPYNAIPDINWEEFLYNVFPANRQRSIRPNINK